MEPKLILRTKRKRNRGTPVRFPDFVTLAHVLHMKQAERGLSTRERVNMFALDTGYSLQCKLKF